MGRRPAAALPEESPAMPHGGLTGKASLVLYMKFCKNKEAMAAAKTNHFSNIIGEQNNCTGSLHSRFCPSLPLPDVLFAPRIGNF